MCILVCVQAACGHLPGAEISINKLHTHTHLCKPRNNISSSFTKAVTYIRFREDESQCKWPWQRMPFPILSAMALNQKVKETVIKRERLVGGGTKGRGFLQPPLSEFYHQPPSSFTFPPDIYFCLFIATWESLCPPLLQAVLTTQVFSGKKRFCLSFLHDEYARWARHPRISVI